MRVYTWRKLLGDGIQFFSRYHTFSDTAHSALNTDNTRETTMNIYMYAHTRMNTRIHNTYAHKLMQSVNGFSKDLGNISKIISI